MMASSFTEDSESKNTIRATKGCKVIFEDYLNEKKLKFPQTSEELAVILQNFYAEVRKKDGLQYTKNSMCSLRFGLNRYFKTLLNIDIIKNIEFDKANRVYEGQCLNLKNMGLAKPERRPPIADEDIMKLYQCGLFNTDSPITLQNKVFFEIIFYFCRRGRSHLRQLRKDDFAIKINEQGQRYVVLTDLHSQSKTDRFTGDDTSNSDEGGIMIATGSPLCPVGSFEKYLSHLNPLNDFLFQRPRQNCTDDSLVWYENSVLGENTLGGRMKAMSIQASLSLEYTNQSIKATAIAILNRHGYEAKDLINGSVRSYKIDQNTKAKMAACLMSAIENKRKHPEVPAGCNNIVDTKCYLNQTKKRKLEQEFSKESTKNEDLHHSVMCKDTKITAVSHDENVAPEQRNSPSPETTKSRRKAPRSQVRKVVRTDLQCQIQDETNATSQVENSETTSNECIEKFGCLEKTTIGSVKKPESYVDVAPDMNHTTTCDVLSSPRNEIMNMQTVEEHEHGAVNETTVTEEDYQRKYFQLLNAMNDLQDKFLVSQRNFEDFVRAREAFIEELKSTLNDKHREIDSVKRELAKSNDKILELEEQRKLYEEKIQNLNQKVDVQKKETEVKQQVSKDKEKELQQLIEKQQEVLEVYKLLTSVSVEKVLEDKNSSTVYDKFRCSVKTAQTKEFEFMLSYDPEFAEVEYTPLALDSQSVDSSFPEYLKERIFFESAQAPNFLHRLIQTFKKPDEK